MFLTEKQTPAAVFEFVRAAIENGFDMQEYGLAPEGFIFKVLTEQAGHHAGDERVSPLIERLINEVTALEGNSAPDYEGLIGHLDDFRQHLRVDYIANANANVIPDDNIKQLEADAVAHSGITVNNGTPKEDVIGATISYLGKELGANMVGSELLNQVFSFANGNLPGGIGAVKFAIGEALNNSVLSQVNRGVLKSIQDGNFTSTTELLASDEYKALAEVIQPLGFIQDANTDEVFTFAPTPQPTLYIPTPQPTGDKKLLSAGGVGLSVGVLAAAAAVAVSVRNKFRKKNRNPEKKTNLNDNLPIAVLVEEDEKVEDGKEVKEGFVGRGSRSDTMESDKSYNKR